MIGRKPRADSRLKNLPDDQQAEIAEHARHHRLVETQAWLRERGIRTSTGALSDFLSWYRLQEAIRRNEQTVATLLQWWQTQHPQASAEELEQIGQAFFSALALQQQDSRAWAAIQQLALRRRQIDVERDKLELLKRRAEQADRTEAVLADATLSPEERQQRIREIYGRG